MSEFAKFGIVGLIGFLVDAGILQAGLSLGLDPIVARLPALSMALTVTFFLNKTFAFKDVSEKIGRQFLQYLSVSAVGALINFVTYTVSTLVFGLAPLMSLVIASVAALSVNFLGYSSFVFNRPPAN